MFTGIIEEIGRVVSTDRRDENLIISIQASFLAELGDSIAVNGVCLTVQSFNPPNELCFFVGFETLRKTQLSGLKEGSRVNLERALTLQTRLSGHFLQGHVDGLAYVVSIEKKHEAYELEFRLPKELLKYCVEKGSIGLNGTSLTLFDLFGDRFKVMMIPHTWNQTQFSTINVGDAVNVEVDVLAKYVERLLCFQ